MAAGGNKHVLARIVLVFAAPTTLIPTISKKAVYGFEPELTTTGRPGFSLLFVPGSL